MSFRSGSNELPEFNRLNLSSGIQASRNWKQDQDYQSCSICNQQVVLDSTIPEYGTINVELYHTFRTCFNTELLSASCTLALRQNNQIASNFCCCPKCREELETLHRLQTELDIKLVQFESVRDHLMEIMIKAYLRKKLAPKEMLPVRLGTWHEFLEEVAAKYLLKDWKLNLEEQILTEKLGNNSRLKRLLKLELAGQRQPQESTETKDLILSDEDEEVDEIADSERVQADPLKFEELELRPNCPKTELIEMDDSDSQILPQRISHQHRTNRTPSSNKSTPRKRSRRRQPTSNWLSAVKKKSLTNKHKTKSISSSRPKERTGKRKYKKRKTSSASAADAVQELICEYCGKLFTKRKNYLNHRRYHRGGGGGSEKFGAATAATTTSRILNCEYGCPATTTFYSLVHQRKHHVRQHPELHLKDAPFYCEICCEIFVTEELLAEHEKCHDDSSKVFRCDVCGKGYGTLQNLNSHQQRHCCSRRAKDKDKDSAPSLTCETCGKVCKFPKAFQSHLRKHQQPIGAQASSSSTTTAELAEPIEIEPKKLRKKPNHVPCLYCDKTLSHRNTRNLHHFKEHREQYLANNAVYCTICYKSFQTQQTLDRHVGKHPKCQFCDRRFFNKYKATEHENTHTGLQPYSCPVCGKRFGQETNFYIHTKIHAAKRPYCCQICPEGETLGYYRRKQLEQHMTKCHSPQQ